ncbi:protein prenylyltransferase [Rickenella mellea]|uniref:Protein farnesyltransferase/geranylgeranyltransferase type-1 subunit alpha n=1 Tax=Rickenella mellea TaxID=50990 RepID=A0A4Y7PUF0_9AGAM|nr:protein prenylyltransferase [Rickenella mellea]
MSSRTSSPDFPPLYAERPEWSDVVPIPQNDEDANPIAPIFYTPEYKDATDYFRGIVKTGEKSKRVLELTESIIRLNPAHYSAWQYRYQTLLSTSSSLSDELTLMDTYATEFLKTYQVWHHRRLLLTLLHQPPSSPSPSSPTPTTTTSPTHTPTTTPPLPLQAELTFITSALRTDAKNYHTWAYRQWVLSHFSRPELWSGEISFVESMLDEDVRNNSAWHHRFFVVFASGVREGDEDREEVRRRELAYTKEKIALAPNNGSAWNYLRGILTHTHTPFATQADFVLPYTLPYPSPSQTEPLDKDVDVKMTDEDKDTDKDEKNSSPENTVVDLENPRPEAGADLPSPLAIEFMADIYEERGGKEDVLSAVELWKSLRDEHDTIRKNYWEFRINDALHPSR